MKQLRRIVLAILIVVLVLAIVRLNRMRSGRDEVHPLEGTQAPAFTLPLLDGGTADLSAHKGKEIVILDFWATWCGPCRMAMPIMDEVAREYADKGVRLYAVNQQENPETIRAFLKEMNLSCTVALDDMGRTSDAYGADGIPHTVIIDKEGRIQSVHLGYVPGIKAQITKELDALLAGKSLVETPSQP